MRNTSSIFFLKALLVFSILILLGNETIGQEYGKLRGFVTDSTSGEALAFGNVFIEDINKGASTNERGLFLIQNIPANKDYELTVSYVGYRTKKVTVHIVPDKITSMNIELSPLSIELQTVVKIGEKVIEKNTTDISIEKISVRQLDVLPKGVETDVLRSVQYIPGVSSTGDISAKYYVRGGGSDENLI
ncbi:MAG TPA: carboxypeptidase-like regulatory domain-containing protein, partial [Ignavibacteriales bacterium]|nr:carboxypeptidase-like regulatory domain-containing protein [Ignavibacteriales bacterium]